jgi:DNA-binding transcriptional ArsR family regulator
MRPQALSNQLRRLAAQGIVASRRDGPRVQYRIRDPCVPSILDRGLCLLEDAQDRQ